MLAEFHCFNTDFAGDVWIQGNEGTIGIRIWDMEKMEG